MGSKKHKESHRSSQVSSVKIPSRSDQIEVLSVPEDIKTESIQKFKKITAVDDQKICLFCPTLSTTIEENLEHMRSIHRFTIMDGQYCVDVSGLLGHLAKRVQQEFGCIYCQHTTKSPEAAQNHMTDKGHCYMNPEDYKDYEAFFDYSKAIIEEVSEESEIENLDGSEEESWEDEELEDGERENKQQDGAPAIDPKKTKGYFYKKKLKKAKVLPSGEVRLADGKIIGSRGFKRYYKQYFRPVESLNNNYRSLMDAAEDRRIALLNQQQLALGIYSQENLQTFYNRTAERNQHQHNRMDFHVSLCKNKLTNFYKE
jgi:pre-60S factor REI1